jgi:hypothetical protein
MITDFKGKIAAAKVQKIKILEIQREIAGAVSCATTYIHTYMYMSCMPTSEVHARQPRALSLRSQIAENVF